MARGGGTNKKIRKIGRKNLVVRFTRPTLIYDACQADALLGDLTASPVSSLPWFAKGAVAGVQTRTSRASLPLTDSPPYRRERANREKRSACAWNSNWIVDIVSWAVFRYCLASPLCFRALTMAKQKLPHPPFTTLEPHLGVPNVDR